MNYESARKAFSTMPRLRHSIPGEEFSTDRSEVIAWLLHHPKTKQHMFDLASGSGAIVFDKETKEWHGREVQ